MNTVTLRRAGGVARSAPLAVWASLAATTWYVLAFNPTDRIGDPTGPCLWHALTGIDGPTCGGTRMYWHLIHGNLIQASRHHLAAIVGLGYGGYALTVWTFAAMAGRPVRLWVPSRRAAVVYVGLFLLYAVLLRNLPWPPFTWFYLDNLT